LIAARSSHLAALEKAKADKEAKGEFASECPGYGGAQDTFYVGTLKGVGRVYQQTFIDTYAKVGFAKLYDRKTPITAADLLNDRVLPFYDEQGVPLLRVLTDRGTEYCGTHDRHEYELYLAVENIDHSRTKTKSPQTTDVIDKAFLSSMFLGFGGVGRPARRSAPTKLAEAGRPSSWRSAALSGSVGAILDRRTGDRGAKSRVRGGSPAAQPSGSLLRGGVRARLRPACVPALHQALVGLLRLLDPMPLPFADRGEIVGVGGATLAAAGGMAGAPFARGRARPRRGPRSAGRRADA
jgi:hypothetical protein